MEDIKDIQLEWIELNLRKYTFMTTLVRSIPTSYINGRFMHGIIGIDLSVNKECTQEISKIKLLINPIHFADKDVGRKILKEVGLVKYLNGIHALR
ncbi:MAG: hypothetical protein LBV67_11715 [Streptococcaceae bacterium]|nr:hypothetical protein [Streptococcaceae bacterium]